ncbi:MAG: bifunctional metallophosphatase/5'-nucleotidase [Candidatus Cryptobacteroides sp.]
MKKVLALLCGAVLLLGGCDVIDMPIWPSGPSEDQNDHKDPDNPQDPENPQDPDNPQDSDGPQGPAESLTLLFTNDFHSQICPIDASATYHADCGGISRIKVLVDSVRAADRAVLLCDAGDFVQGSFYFTCFGGEVEMLAQRELAYNIKTIGNHEFDKKMGGLDYMLRYNDVPVVSSNYDFSATSISDRVYESYMMEVEGRKIGFIGLNVRLSGLVDPNSSEGVVFQSAISQADRCAGELKEKGAELVVALSHLGYLRNSDADYYDRGIAMNTRYIDCIIGGHTHTFLPKEDYVTNLAGKQVPIVQTGCKGIYLGEMKVDFTVGDPKFKYRLIPVNARLDSRVDKTFQAQIDYYTNLLEESMNEVLAYCPKTMRKGTPEALLSNFTADAVYNICKEYFGVEPDLAIYNNGGIRAEMPAGNVTRGTIYSIYPFDNVLTLIEIKGSDLLDAFQGIAAYGGEPVSSTVELKIRGRDVVSLMIGNKPIVSDWTYKVATINYLIDATNYLSALRNYTSRRESGVYIYELMADYVKSLGDQGIPLTSELDGRVTIIE